MNRAERRARIFTRPPQPKPAPAQAPHPEAAKSGITPLRDAYDELISLGMAEGVPFAKRDEDLIAPSTVKDTAVEYIAEFDSQRCQCGMTTPVFRKLFEKRSTGVEVPVPRIPQGKYAVNRFTAAIQFVPVCHFCTVHPTQGPKES